MKHAVLAIVLLLVSLPVRGQGEGDLQEEDPLGIQIRRLCYYIDNGDPVEREHAVQALIELGRPALPLVEKAMEGKPEGTAAHYLRVRAAINKPEFETPEAKPADERTNLLESYFRGRYEQARELYRQGKFDRAREIVDAVLVLEPALPFRDEVLELREELRRRELLVGSLSPYARANREFVAWGEPVLLDFFVLNVGQGDFAFLARSTDGEGQVHETTIRVMAEMVQYDLSGSSHTSKLQLATGLASDVRIAPDERWSGSLEFNPVKEMRPGFLAARIEVRAALQIVEVVEGGPINASGIPFLPVTVTVLHPDYLKLARDPIGSFVSAIEGQRRREAFLASFLIPRGELKRTIDQAVERLPTAGPETQECLFAILGRWTGERSNSVEFWRQWWAARRERWVPPHEG